MKARASRMLMSVLLLAVVLPASASAIDYSLFASYWDTEEADSSVGYGLRMSFFKVVGLEIGVSYFGDLERTLTLDELESKLGLKAIPIDVGARLQLGRTLYFSGGLSAYILDPDAGDFDEEFGYYAALGFAGRRMFVEARYRDVEGTVTGLDTFPERLDLETGELVVDLTGLELTLGFRF